MSTRCGVFWGSHGCDLPANHEGHHQCLLSDIPGEECCDAFYENGILMVIWRGFGEDDPEPVPYGDDMWLFQWNEELQKFEDIEP